MEFFGKLTHKLETVEIETKNGPKAKMSFVILQPGQYGQPACFETLNAAAISFLADTKIGTELKVVGDVRSREYNGKWYTNLTAGIIEVSKAPGSMEVKVDAKSELPAGVNAAFVPGTDADSLPF